MASKFYQNPRSYLIELKQLKYWCHLRSATAWLENVIFHSCRKRVYFNLDLSRSCFDVFERRSWHSITSESVARIFDNRLSQDLHVQTCRSSKPSIGCWYSTLCGKKEISVNYTIQFSEYDQTVRNFWHPFNCQLLRCTLSLFAQMSWNARKEGWSYR